MPLSSACVMPGYSLRNSLERVSKDSTKAQNCQWVVPLIVSLDCVGGYGADGTHHDGPHVGSGEHHAKGLIVA